MKKIIKMAFGIFYFVFVHIFSCFFYDKNYFKSRWFKTPFSDGWHWAYVDIIHRIVFHRHLDIPWPISPYVNCGKNIDFDIDDLDNFQSQGSYYQTYGKIKIGKGCQIAQNVGIITANHDSVDIGKHSTPKDVEIKDFCWIGMNSTILPGVTLGPHTIVGAGSVVTKSFMEGYVVIAGNPARVIKKIVL